MHGDFILHPGVPRQMPSLVGVVMSPELGVEYVDFEAGAVSQQLPWPCRRNGNPGRGLLLRWRENTSSVEHSDSSTRS